MAFKLPVLFRRKSRPQSDRCLAAVVNFSLAAPSALDPERLSDAIALLERFNWDAGKAALYVANTTANDFDDAMMEKGDDPFGGDHAPGPSS